MRGKTKARLIEELTGLRRSVTELTVQHEKLTGQMQQQACELEVLFQLSQAITANLGLNKVLETAYLGVGKLIPNEAFWIAYYQPGAEFYHYLILIDRGKHYPLVERSIKHGVGGYVIRTGQPCLLTDLSTQTPFPVAHYGSTDPVKSVLCVPLLIGERMVGVMSTQSYQVDAYSEADLELLVRLAQPIAIALENAQLYQVAQQRAQELSRINDNLQQEIIKREQAEVALRKHQEHLEEQVSRRTAELLQANTKLHREIEEHQQAEEKRAAHERFLTLLNEITYTALKTSNLQEMLQILADRLGELIHADGCYITLWDEVNQRTIPAAASTEAYPPYQLIQVKPDERTMTQSVLEAGHVLVVEDVFNTPHMSPNIAAQFPSRSLLALPLIAHQEKLGAALIAFNTPHRFTAAEIAYCGQAAQQVALAMAKARLVEALKESEERYHDLFEYATDAIFIETITGDILAANEKACQLLGYTKEELLSLKVADIIVPRPAIEREFIRSALKEGQALLLEAQNRRKDGSLVEVEVSMRLIGLKDQEIAQVFVRDITQRKQLEKQLQQLKRIEAISVLAGGIAHEFNNLLTIITGNCELVLLDPELSDQTRIDIQKVAKAGKRAAALTSRLLAFSRQQQLFPRMINLNTLVTTMIQMLKRLLGETVELVTQFDPALGLVKVDPGQFEQVIVTLVSNAGDAMPCGGKLTLETANVYLDKTEANLLLYGQPGRYIKFTVSDTGHGMDQATQAHLFEPFFTTKEVGQGVGLGLAMVYGVIKQSDGYIQVQSEPGQGTTFNIFLPHFEAEADDLPAV